MEVTGRSRAAILRALNGARSPVPRGTGPLTRPAPRRQIQDGQRAAAVALEAFCCLLGQPPGRSRVSHRPAAFYRHGSARDDRLVRLAPKLKPYLRRPSPTWPEIIDAAEWLRHDLGVSKPLWGDACLAMGRDLAAIALAIVSTKELGHFRTSPGGYFHGMVAKAAGRRIAPGAHGVGAACAPRSRISCYPTRVGGVARFSAMSNLSSLLAPGGLPGVPSANHCLAKRHRDALGRRRRRLPGHAHIMVSRSGGPHAVPAHRLRDVH